MSAVTKQKPHMRAPTHTLRSIQRQHRPVPPSCCWLCRCSALLTELLSHIDASSGLDLQTEEGQTRATQLLSECFAVAAEERIIQLQKIIEGYAADIARKATKAAHEAGEHKGIGGTLRRRFCVLPSAACPY